MEGDLHDIGKNLVAMMWKGANIEVIDLGVNVSPAAFVSAVETHRPQVVGMSALLTTTMPRMRNAVAAVKAAGIDTKVVIGGAPVTEEFAAEVGADGFAPDAASAVDVVRELLAAAPRARSDPSMSMFSTYGRPAPSRAQARHARQAGAPAQDVRATRSPTGSPSAISSGAASGSAGAGSWGCPPTPIPTTTTTST